MPIAISEFQLQGLPQHLIHSDIYSTYQFQHKSSSSFWSACKVDPQCWKWHLLDYCTCW